MKTEISAGGVVIRPAKKLRAQPLGLSVEVLLIKDMNGHWTFPKGYIEARETPEQAAVREIHEEVGLSVTIRVPLSTIEYWYQTDGQKIHKTVHYFLCDVVDGKAPVPQTEEGISEVQWVSLADALSIIGYPKTNKPLLEELSSLVRPVA